MLKHSPLLLLSIFLFYCNSSTDQANRVVTNPPTVGRKPVTETIVILGSSTAAGLGASTYKNAWAGRLASYFSTARVVNLARGGYNSYQILPTNTPRPANRPPADTLYNLTAALKAKPTILIISMTTNDIVVGHSVNEVVTNFNLLRKKALAAGVGRVLITTPIPRKVSPEATTKFLLQRNLVLKNYGVSAINIFDPVANAQNLFRPEWLSSDGIHPNDEGHKVIYEVIKKAVLISLARPITPQKS